MCHRERLTSAACLRRFLLQFRWRALRLLAKRRLRFFRPLFRSAPESDFPSTPSRSSLRDKSLHSTTLAPWPLPDCSSWDPSPAAGSRSCPPQRPLQAPPSHHSQFLGSGRLPLGEIPSPTAARQVWLELPARSLFDKSEVARHPPVLPPFHR